jgi:hypothetical protein
MERRGPERRVTIDVPVELVAEGGGRCGGRGIDVSIGGMRVAMETPAEVGTIVVVRAHLPGAVRTVVLPAVVRWNRQGVVGLQFGLLGAWETHLIATLAVDGSRTLGVEDVAWIG